MPIDDERRRFGRAKATPGTKPQTAVSTKDKSRLSDETQESLQRLQEMLLLRGSEQVGFRAEEEKRIDTSKQAAERARSERNEKYERLQRAFEQMNRWKDEEEAEVAGEESGRIQGTGSLSCLRLSVTDVVMN